jgi:hypothetical protein
MHQKTSGCLEIVAEQVFEIQGLKNNLEVLK